VLAGVVGGDAILAPILAALLERGRVVKIGDRKGTLYALAGWKRAA